MKVFCGNSPCTSFSRNLPFILNKKYLNVVQEKCAILLKKKILNSKIVFFVKLIIKVALTIIKILNDLKEWLIFFDLIFFKFVVYNFNTYNFFFTKYIKFARLLFDAFLTIFLSWFNDHFFIVIHLYKNTKLTIFT